MATRKKSSRPSRATRRQARKPKSRDANPAASQLRVNPAHHRAKQFSLDPRFIEGIDLYNSRQFFRAHEVLEQVWLETTDRSRDFYKGLIQAAVSFYHWSKSNPNGAVSLYRSSSQYLKKYRPEWLGVDVDAFLDNYTQLFGWLHNHTLRYDSRLVPPIRWKIPPA